MLQTMTLLQDLTHCHDKALAGGKAVNLGVLLRAGFPVPDGFCITTDAYRYWISATDRQEIPSDLADEICRAYRAMGSPPVAVRSSATAEDLAEASMAGQYDTFLDVTTEDALLDRVRLCWASLDSPRTRAYLQQHGIDLAKIAMAVVVQRLVPADVAGVLFTANPQTGSKSEMLVEASWGLGEAVVSGLVQPDILRIDKQTGRVTHATIADKQVMIPPTGLLTSVSKSSHTEHPVPEDKRRTPCLKGPDVTSLWKLGLQASQHFGGPQDIEWALHQGKLYLLQSRPITTLEDAEAYEHLLTTTRAQLRDALAQDHGPWVIHNLAETLPHPTPLTWSVLRRFMSGDGGFGRMYRQAGFEPSPTVCRDGFLTLIAGKVYMDASLAPEMFFENFPFKYDPDELRRNPDAAQNPPTLPSGPLTARLKMAKRATAASHTVHQLATDYDQTLTKELIPAFEKWVAEEKSKELTPLSTDELIALWHAREKRVMDDFAPASLLPSLISAGALADLKSFLEESFWNDDPDALTHLLSSAHPPDSTLRSNIALYELAQHATPSPGTPGEGGGEGSSSSSDISDLKSGSSLASPLAVSPPPLADYLSEFGHRAPEEFDLATPRWRERPDQLLTLAARLKSGKNPADLHAHHHQTANTKLHELRARLSPGDQQLLDQKLNLARRYMPFREDAKHHLMRGYDLLRDCALEIGRRLEINNDIFLLTLEEAFDALHIGFPPTHLIAQRKIQRRAEARIPLPHLIDATNIETLGAPPQSAIRNPQSAILEAFPISPGAATAPARIVRNPTDPVSLPDRYILVCPSTDPSWTPLFTNAAGLILERGGTLSHGAVVAREMSIPAVVLRDATTLLHDDDDITLDGRQGTVTRTIANAGGVASATRSAPSPGTPGEGRGGGSSSDIIPSTTPLDDRTPSTPERADPNDTRIPRALVPPPPGRLERQSAKLRNLFLAIWGIYLLATFLLPEQILYQPSLHFLDLLLWPLVRLFGKPAAVALIASALAALTMLGQKYLTDNARLRAAKHRAATLTDEANQLPEDSPRAKNLRRLAAPVQTRIVLASFVPLAVLLGPMVMIFCWLEPRVAPAAWNSPPNTPVTVVAMVKPEFKIFDAKGVPTVHTIGSVTLDVPPGVTLAQPANQSPPQIRRVLEKLRDKTRKPSDLTTQPWEVRESAERYRTQYLSSLNDYLKDIPPVPMTWNVTLPDNTPGHWPITLRAENAKSLSTAIVLGDAHPPVPAEVSNTPADPLTSLKITYQGTGAQKPFFAPIAHRDWGWLGVYLAAYLPVMFLLRAALKIA